LIPGMAVHLVCTPWDTRFN